MRRSARLATSAALALARLTLGAACCITLWSCGGITAPDLFLVTRSGSVAGAKLTLLVNEEGGVNCNGGRTLKLDDAQLIEARDLQEELHETASKHLALPPQPGSVFSYRLRDENGTVSFSDNSRDQPRVLQHLALFVLQTAQRVCRLPL